MPTGVTPPPPATDPPPWSASLRTVAQLSIGSRWSSVDMINVHHIMAIQDKEDSFAGGRDDLRLTWCQNLIDAWQGGPRTALLAMHTSAFTLTSVGCQVLEVPGQLFHRLAPVAEVDTGAGTRTGTTGQPLQAFTAAVVRWKTLQAKRTARGRTYFGGWYTDDISNTQVTFAAQGLLEAYVAALLAAFGGTGITNGGQLVVYSRPYRLQEWTTSSAGVLTVWGKAGYAGTATPIVSHTIDTNARVQRRREIGVGI